MDNTEKWLNSLSDKERNQVNILDAYFSSRYNMPGKSKMNGTELDEDDRTTFEIIDELAEMVDLDMSLVVQYMYANNFLLTTGDDGVVKWAIWRDMKPLI